MINLPSLIDSGKEQVLYIGRVVRDRGANFFDRATLHVRSPGFFVRRPVGEAGDRYFFAMTERHELIVTRNGSFDRVEGVLLLDEKNRQALAIDYMNLSKRNIDILRKCTHEPILFGNIYPV